jgi:hypothetical protein
VLQNGDANRTSNTQPESLGLYRLFKDDLTSVVGRVQLVWNRPHLSWERFGNARGLGRECATELQTYIVDFVRMERATGDRTRDVQLGKVLGTRLPAITHVFRLNGSCQQ